ncbi:ATP-grasp domain-containing protein [Schlesneria sp. T3-172]|uniref:ATP-grasp domain-containing protein n=1 Tax=Schlesneria sphaerica TaxID=3373610 RepID=UPI0037C69FE7
MSSRQILIIGGSTRAAADSVRRAGWRPICADFFVDWDLQQTAQTIPVRRYPESLPDDLAHIRADGWMYCGALENEPQILARLLEENRNLGPLIGTHPETLAHVRNPSWISSVLRAAGLPCLDVASQSAPPPPDGCWLQKPLSSAGGRQIRVWDEVAERSPFVEPHYFQRRVSGSELSVLFRCDEGKPPAWLGATRALRWANPLPAPTPFSYCGSTGPVTDLPDHIVRSITEIVTTIVSQTSGLNGLVGFDFIEDPQQAWLLEINPRYTASVEVLELASGRSLLSPQPVSCQAVSGRVESGRDHGTNENHQRRIVAKQILYAVESISAPDLRHSFRSIDPWQIPIVTDIPQVPLTIDAGWPICTVFAEGSDPVAVKEMLRMRGEAVRSAIRA